MQLKIIGLKEESSQKDGSKIKKPEEEEVMTPKEKEP